MTKKISIVLGLIFFLFALFTLPNYGINWDAINHIPRGQAYLHYLFTGKTTFADLPEWKLYWQNPESLGIDANIPKNEVPQRSAYTINEDMEYYITHDGDGHPPLSGMLSSLFNEILFVRLRLVNDIDAYRVYGVFLAACLVGLVFYWASKVYGKRAGLIAAFSLVLYPLFFAYSHFNTEKDIPETVYWSFMLFAVWRGVTKNSWRWILTSGVFFGLALGTKLNIVFSSLAIAPWLLFYLFETYKTKRNFSINKFLKKHTKLLAASLAAPLIGFGIFFGSWPYLWDDPVGKINKMIGFYKSAGTGVLSDPRYMGPLGTNTYGLQWILYITPLVILVFFSVGVLVALYRLFKEKDKVSLLFLLWFAVPVVRATWPGAYIHGGVRQIMEYIPAVALLAGLGGITIATWLEKVLKTVGLPKILASLTIIGAFIPITMKIISIHPNEVVYFNPLIGGLAGAKEKDLMDWGESYGSPYRLGAKWINENAEKGAKLAFAFELMPNIPRVFMRRDIDFANQNRSGYLRSGEYIITLNSRGVVNRSYLDTYLDKFINPVYESSVDGIPVVRVWKNDDAHLKVPMVELQDKEVSIQKKDSGFVFDLGEVRKLARLEIDYTEENCKPLELGVFQVSPDNENWIRIPGNLPDSWRISQQQDLTIGGKFIEPFNAEEARFIDTLLLPKEACMVAGMKAYRVYYFADE